MKKDRKYTVRKFSTTQQIMNDYLEVSGSFPKVMGLVEINITEGRKKIREIKERENYSISLTAWTAKCIAKAVSEDKRFNSFRKGRNKIVVFDDVDMSVMVEILRKDGKKVPYNHTIRKIDTKSIKEITDEIREIQQRKIDEQEQLTRDSTSKFSSLYSLIPAFIRRFFIKRMIKNPFSVKKLMGTVGLTSLGGNVRNMSGYGIPLRDKTLNVMIGGITDKLVKEGNEIVTHECLNLCLQFDHALVDGAPAARFVKRINELMNSAYGLEVTRENVPSFIHSSVKEEYSHEVL
jgi:pyruvate/2-oxoglutarate dehydrogenase complex dihydrolipoamide acyltransferase (E2) component